MSSNDGETDALRSPGMTAMLARFGAALQFDDLPIAVVVRLKHCVLDTLGCCVLGASLPSVGKLAAVMATEQNAPVATVLGTRRRTSVGAAALLNGTAAHAFQLDEIHLESTLHPGPLALPAALALAEMRSPVDGRTLLTALAAGYEVGIRVGLALKGGMFRSGFHNQGTTGALVAAVTAARILGLDHVGTAHALGIAASQAAGLMAVQGGAMTKSLHCGRAAQSGVLAAQLAQIGYTGIPDVLDGAYGTFFPSFARDWAPEALIEGLGHRWHTLRVGFKNAPAANGSITAMTAVDRIMREHALEARDIAQITAFVSHNTLHHCGWPYVADKIHSVLSAQMNLRYGIAAMALDREVGVAQFDESRIRRSDILAFVERITVEHQPRFDADGGRHRIACRLIVATMDGTTHETTVLYRKGSPEDPMTPLELRHKFDQAAAILDPARREQIADQVAKLETLTGMSSFAALLVPAAS